MSFVIITSLPSLGTTGTELEIALAVSDMPGMTGLIKGLENNHDLALKEKEIEKAQAKVEIESLSSYPDITLQAGYAARENFDDFATFGAGCYWGTEKFFVKNF